jgi:hypothetical protein
VKTKAEAGLGLAILSLHQALISAKENNCPLKPVTTGKHCLMWTPELKFPRRAARWLFNKCWGDCTQAQRRFRRKVWKASGEALRAFFSSVNDFPRRLGYTGLFLGTLRSSWVFLVATSGRRTQSEGETLELLLASHFPNSTVTEEMAIPAVVCGAKRRDWRVAARVVTYRIVE